MKHATAHKMYTLAMALCALTAMAQPGVADVRSGGDASDLFHYDLEEFADHANTPDGVFVMLGNSDLGITIGEKLVGQVNTPEGDFDVVSGSPLVPLSMDTSVDAAVGVNLMRFRGTIIVGLGSSGYPQRSAIGEGSVTVLFDRDQQLVSFDVVGANGDSLDVLFYSRYGLLLGHAQLTGVTDGTYAFNSDSPDIAAYTINNSDFGGLGLDNFGFEPGSAGGVSGPVVSCPADLSVECDGDGNITELNAWLDEATAAEDSEVSSDFYGLSNECGATGSATVTWWASLPTGDPDECSATFTVVDTTPPAIDMDQTPILAVDEDCSGDEEVSLPVAETWDLCDPEPVVTYVGPSAFPAGTTTTTVFTTTDECGNSSETTVDVTVEFGCGVEVQLDEKAVGSGKASGSAAEPLADATVADYVTDEDSCASLLWREGSGDPRFRYEAITAECHPANTGRTDSGGVTFLGLPPGRYLLIAPLDLDADGTPDVYLGKPTGKVRCGHWTAKRLRLRTDSDGSPIQEHPGVP